MAIGTEDNDTLIGNGDDSLIGLGGNDRLESSDDLVFLDGGSGNDTISASGDNATLSGGDGNDKLYAGDGSNTLTGGAGRDIFDVSGDGTYTITDFGPDKDTIVFDDIFFGDVDWQYVYTNLTEVDGNVTIVQANGSSLTLEGISRQEFNESWLRPEPVFHGTTPDIDPSVRWIDTPDGEEISEGALVNALPNGGYAVTWLNSAGEDSNGSYVRDFSMRIFDANGNETGDLIAISPTPGVYHSPEVEVLATGDIVATWFQYRLGYGWLRYQTIVDQDGDRILEPTLIPTDQTTGGFHPVTTLPLDDGSYLSIFTPTGSPGMVEVRHFDATGQRLRDTPDELFNPGWGTTDLSATQLSDGKIAVAWSHPYSDSDALIRIFDTDYNQVGEDIIFAEYSERSISTPEIKALASGGFVVAWIGTEANSDTSALYFRMYDASGTPINDETILNGGLHSAKNPNILVLEDDSVLFVWLEGGIKTQLVDSSGVPLHISEGVGQSPRGGSTIDIALLEDGTVVVTSHGLDNVVTHHLSPGDGQAVTDSDDHIILPDTYGFYDYYNLLAGRGGNDTLVGNVEDETILGDSGNDSLIGGYGDDTLYGGAGHDYGAGGSGDDTLTGGDGDDTLEGGLGDDILRGGSGADVIRLGAGWGSDRVWDFEPGVDLVDLRGSGLGYWDILSGLGDNGTEATFTDGAGNSIVFSGVAPGAISASDFLFDGNVLLGGDDSDTLTGSPDADYLLGFDGDDSLSGGAGDDTLLGGMGADTLSGGEGDDTAAYGDISGAISVNLDTGVASGAAGTDHLSSIEAVEAGAGDDTLIGSLGDDTLSGGAGDDTLMGGLGDDVLSGGEGDDRFAFAGDWGADRITGFTAGEDILDFSASELGFDDLSIRQVGDDTVIEDNAGNSITLEGVTATTVDATSFSFGNEIDGTAAGESLAGSFGRDVIRGFAGNDTLTGGDGSDTLEGGDHDDLLQGGSGIDVISGGSGDDTVEASAEEDISSGEGFDAEMSTGQISIAEDGLSYVYEGGRSREAVPASEAMNEGQWYWEVQLDDIQGSNSNLYLGLIASSDNDWSDEVGRLDDVVMIRGRGELYMSNGRSLSREMRGLDKLSEDDVVGVAFDADSGALWISINGEWQNDATAEEIAAGDTRHAVVTGLEGAYVPIAAGWTTGSRYGHTASLHINADAMEYAGPDGFLPYGQAGSPTGGDTVDGGAGEDWVDLSALTPVLSSGINMGETSLSDTGGVRLAGDLYLNMENLIGTGLNDTLNGGSADNILNGGDGDDSLSGGQGNDRFIFSANHGNDIINDFSIDGDIIDLTDLNINSLADLNATQAIFNNQSGVLLSTSIDSTIFITDLTFAALVDSIEL